MSSQYSTERIRWRCPDCDGYQMAPRDPKGTLLCSACLLRYRERVEMVPWNLKPGEGTLPR